MTDPDNGYKSTADRVRRHRERQKRVTALLAKRGGSVWIKNATILKFTDGALAAVYFENGELVARQIKSPDSESPRPQTRRAIESEDSGLIASLHGNYQSEEADTW